MKFYHIADVHLGAVPDRTMPWSKERARGLYESFYRLLARAKEEQIDVVFICGDLFHRQPLKRELKELNYHFEKAAPVLIFIIAGNHDYITEESNYVNYPWSKNVKLITSEHCQRVYIEHLKLCVYGFSYHSYEIFDAVYDGIKPQLSDGRGGALPLDCCHILMAHGGDEKHIPMHFNTMASSGFDYIAMGHIHKPWLKPSGKMAYSGSLEPVDQTDEGPHGFIAGETLGRHVNIRFIPFAQWNYASLSVEVDPSMSWEAVKDQVRAAAEGFGAASGFSEKERLKYGAGGSGRPGIGSGNGNIYKVILKGYKNVELAYDIEEIYRLGNIVSVVDEMEYDFDFESLYEANRGNLLGRYIEKVWAMDIDEDMRKKILYYGFNALYKTRSGT